MYQIARYDDRLGTLYTWPASLGTEHMRAGFTPGAKGEGVAVISKYSFRIFIHDQALHSSSCGGHLTKWHKQMTDKIAYKSLDKTF